MKLTKRFMALLLAMVMMVSLVPVTAFAIGGQIVCKAVDNQGNLIPGVGIALRINRGGTWYDIDQGTTNENGSVTFTNLNSIQNGDSLICDPTNAEYDQNASKLRYIGNTRNGVQVLEYSNYENAKVTSNSVNVSIYVVVVNNNTPATYTVIWKNWDGSVLETDTDVAENSAPVYNGATPTRAADAQYTYEFSGWTPVLSPVTADVEYTAQYTATEIPVTEYAITWVNDGDTLATGTTTEPDADHNYTGETPTKEATAQYSYTFAGWEKAVNSDAKSITYTAKFTPVTRTYTITWKNADGTELEVDENVPYGETPVYNGETPNKAADENYTYTFSGWDPEIKAVAGPETYTATYDQEAVAVPDAKHSVTMTVLDQNGNPLSGIAMVLRKRLNGGTPVQIGEAKTTGADGTVVFDDLELEDGMILDCNPVDAAYTWNLTHTNGARVVTVTTGDAKVNDYNDNNGGRWQDAEITGNINAADIKFTCNLIAPVTTYTVYWKNGNDVLETDENVAAGAAHEYNGATPTKDSTAQYDYSFDKWSDAVVDEEAKTVTYSALFAETTRSYTITWVIDGVETTETLAYGATPAHAAPTKEATVDKVYTFTGWSPAIAEVTGDATYTARFSETAREYTITWIVEGEQTTAQWAYGETPVYEGTPEKASADGYDYTFAGWTPEIAAVTGDAAYTAEFEAKCNHETGFFGHCKEGKDCTHPAGCECNPDVAEGARSVNIITKNDKWERIGNVPVFLMMNPNDGSAHVKLDWTGTTDENGDVAVPAEVLENVKSGSTLYACVDTADGKFDWAYEIGETPVRLVSQGDKLVNTGITKDGDGNEYAWIAAEDGVGFNAEFTLFVKQVEEVTEPEEEAVTHTVILKVLDQEGKDLSGIEMVLRKRVNGGEPEVIATKAANEIGEVVFEGLELDPGDILDCDPVDTETYSWNFEADLARVAAVKGSAEVLDLSNDNGAWQDAKIVAGEEAAMIKFTCNLVKAEEAPEPQAPTHTVTLTVLDRDGKALAGVEMVLRKRVSGGEPVAIGAGETDEDGKITFEVGLSDGDILDCDPKNVVKYDWDWDMEMVRIATSIEGGAEAIDLPQGDAQWQDARVTDSTEDIDIQFTCYLVKKVRSYTITWMNGETVLDTDVVDEGVTPVYTGETPTKAAETGYTYTFAGWQEEIVPAAADATYNAVFTKTANKYSIKLDANGGRVNPDEKEVTYGQKIGTLPTPTRKGYEFKGWYTAKIGGTRVTADTVYNTAGDDIYYAHWKKVSEPTNPVQPGHKHHYEMEYNTKYHWEECKCGDTKHKESHDFGKWITTRKGTEDSTGMKYRECEVCGYKQWKEIPKSFNPNTGDTIMVAVGVMLAAGAALACLFVYKKKRK